MAVWPYSSILFEQKWPNIEKIPHNAAKQAIKLGGMFRF